MAEGVETGIPGVEEQKLFITNQLQKPLIKGETWYGFNAAFARFSV